MLTLLRFILRMSPCTAICTSTPLTASSLYLLHPSHFFTTLHSRMYSAEYSIPPNTGTISVFVVGFERRWCRQSCCNEKAERTSVPGLCAFRARQAKLKPRVVGGDGEQKWDGLISREPAERAVQLSFQLRKPKSQYAGMQKRTCAPSFDLLPSVQD